MEAYGGFALVYDEFMDNVDYHQWCDYAAKLLTKYGAKDGTLVEIGCGTGTGTMLFHEKGYNMIGIDLSQEMLEIAESKKEEEDIVYVLQDATNLQLPYAVPAMVSIGDSMNYITDYGDFTKVFERVNEYLEDDGVFVFDLKTIELYRSIGESVIAEDREDCSFIWDNYFDEKDCINEYMLSIFVKGDDNRYDKFSEEHYQRAYTVEEIKEALNLAGLEFVTVYDAFTRNEPNSESERIYVVARECQKNQVSK